MRIEGWQQTTTLMPRICLLSGLSGAEQIAVAEAWADYAGSPSPFFAAAVPNSLDQPVRAVLQVCTSSGVFLLAAVDIGCGIAAPNPVAVPACTVLDVGRTQL